MTRYLVLYRSPTSAPDQMADATPEQAQSGMDAWMAWAGRAGSALVDLGAPLTEVGSVGTSAPAAGPIGGFSILQAESVDDLKALLTEHPHLMLDGAGIEIHELLDLPGAS